MKKILRAINFGVFATIIFPAMTAYAAPTVPQGFQVNTVVSGLSLPTAFQFAPDGRMFIGQKSGAVRIFKNGQLLPNPVVQLTDINDYADRGLEGLALDPNFSQNGYMYIAYTYENNPGQDYKGNKTGRIIRLTVVGDTASLASKVVILGSVGGDAAHPSCRNFATTSDCAPSDSNTHSMGALRFGPDGKLWATLGDGAGYLTVDPLAMDAQDIHSLGGKMIRINTDGTAPSDNPFYNGNPNDNQSKVWSFGHRNSYRFSFRPSDGKIFFGDVGWATWEELNIGGKGRNFAWPCREGYITTSYNCTPVTASTDPIYVYDHHTGTGTAIGGVFLPASNYSVPYANNYFFGDYGNDILKRVVLNSDDSVASVEDFVTGAGGPVDFSIGPDGALYYAAINVGQIRKFVQGSGNRPPVASITANPTSGPAPLTVHFSGSNSSDPDNDPLTYAWNFGDGQTSTAANPDHVYNTNAIYTATLTVTDSHAASNAATAHISVGQTQSGANPHHVETVIAPSPVVIGHEETLTTTISNSGTTAPFIIDMEIYNSSNVQVAQKIYENQSVPTGGQSQFGLTWLPPAIGDYSAKIGLFKSGWSGMYEWNDQALPIKVLNRAPTGSPSFTQSTTVTANPAVGSTDTIGVTVKDTGDFGDALIDIEVYKDGVQVGQKAFDNQHFEAGESKNFSYAYPVTSDGTYKISVGVFKTGWAGIYTWFDQVASFTTSGGASSNSIYTDSLASGWENWSWGSTINFSDTSYVYQGSSAIKIRYDSPWAGMFLHNPGLDTSGKANLAFAVNGGVSGGQTLQIFTYDANGIKSSVKNLSAYVSGGTIDANTWKQVSIPLADIGAQNKIISGIVIQDVSGNSGVSVNIDALRVE